MKTIEVNASQSYRVFVGHGILSHMGMYIKDVTSAERVVIISDSNVFPIYGDRVIAALSQSGFSNVFVYTLSAGEESKNGITYLSILEFLAQCRMTRSDCIIALGGGVVGDMAGFVSATYLRGIDYIQVPTTLLAAVDSSVGGKTAIDLSSGKNLAGAFYQPKLVLCDIETLTSLPVSVFRDGCAEVIKYGILYDSSLFHDLLNAGLAFEREAVITRCIELKRDAVLQDEFDHGARQMLNLGHTLGHAVEKNSNYTVTHGSAVAIGTSVIARASMAAGICCATTCQSILSILERFELPTRTDISIEAIYNSALSDKKRAGSLINLIVPKKIGECAILPIQVEKLKAFIETGF